MTQIEYLSHKKQFKSRFEYAESLFCKNEPFFSELLECLKSKGFHQGFFFGNKTGCTFDYRKGKDMVVLSFTPTKTVLKITSEIYKNGQLRLSIDDVRIKDILQHLIELDT